MAIANIIIEICPKPTDSRFIDLDGLRFGRLVVLGYAGKSRTRTSWLCRCDCGKMVRVIGQGLKDGSTRSCACLRKEVMTIHGQSRTVEYNAYAHAKDRCTNPASALFKYYGQRGIEFRFNSFAEFYSEVGERPSLKHSLDREDNNGHYEKGNVRWATKQVQCMNRRSTRLLTIDGIEKSVTEWGLEFGKPNYLILSRLTDGYCESCAVKLPLKKPCPH